MADYLFEENQGSEVPKFEDIMDTLKEIYSYNKNGENYSDYECLVTGHSLGGSLAQLLTFTLAGSPQADFIPKPIIGITYASPVVGTKRFLEVTQELERANKLRHIRVSNHRDVVPGSPITGGYTQTGVNIHLKKGKKPEVGYRNTKTFYRLLRLTFPSYHFLESGDNSYFSQVFAKDKNGEFLLKDVFDMSVQDLYTKYAGDCSR